MSNLRSLWLKDSFLCLGKRDTGHPRQGNTSCTSRRRPRRQARYSLVHGLFSPERRCTGDLSVTQAPSTNPCARWSTNFPPLCGHVGLVSPPLSSRSNENVSAAGGGGGEGGPSALDVSRSGARPFLIWKVCFFVDGFRYVSSRSRPVPATRFSPAFPALECLTGECWLPSPLSAPMVALFSLADSLV